MIVVALMGTFETPKDTLKGQHIFTSGRVLKTQYLVFFPLPIVFLLYHFLPSVIWAIKIFVKIPVAYF
jgi:hypothetical protein